MEPNTNGVEAQERAKKLSAELKPDGSNIQGERRRINESKATGNETRERAEKLTGILAPALKAPEGIIIVLQYLDEVGNYGCFTDEKAAIAKAEKLCIEKKQTFYLCKVMATVRPEVKSVWEFSGRETLL